MSNTITKSDFYKLPDAAQNKDASKATKYRDSRSPVGEFAVVYEKKNGNDRPVKVKLIEESLICG